MKKHLCYILLLLLAYSCRQKDETFQNPYEGGKSPLGIKFSNEPPAVTTAPPGTIVSFKITGLQPYRNQAVFSFNGQPAQVMELDSQHINVKVPDLASTGNVQVVVGDQIFYGPVFNVAGKIEKDITFHVTTGTNGPVNKMEELPDGRFLMVGGFTNYENKGVVNPLNGIIVISRSGELDRSMLFGRGVNGSISDVVMQPDGKMMIAGGFSAFDKQRGGVHGMFNICRLNANGSPDTITVQSFTKKDTVPAFNGGTDDYIQALFQDAQGGSIAVGNFKYYLRKRYGVSTSDHLKDSLVVDSIEAGQLIRFKQDGAIDSSYHYDLIAHKGRPATNGYISGAVMQPDGKIILFGRFSKYDGMSVLNIARINVDGSLDPSFTAGADNAVTCITYNVTTKQYVVTGGFINYNNKKFNGIVLVDDSFNPVNGFSTGVLEDGGISYGFQLNNGLIIAAGYFGRYDNVQRNGFMVIDNKGKLVPGYNSTGKFQGSISNMLETKTTNGDIQLTLMGFITTFNGQAIGNITRLLLK